MKVLEFTFCIMPIVIIFCAILFILAMIIKNKTISEIIMISTISILLIYFFSLMGIVAPLMFIRVLFDDLTGILYVFCLIFFVWGIITLTISVRNKQIIKKYDTEEIYIRDIDVEYSPAVLSYLINNKVETKKDLPATLLNLCSKKILKIEKLDTGEINIIDLKNEEGIEKLSNDEKYAYKMLKEGITLSKINIWKNKVEDEYKKYRFSKQNKKDLTKYLLGIYISCFAILSIYLLVYGEADSSNTFVQIMFKSTFVSFLGIWEFIIFLRLKTLVIVLINRNEKQTFKDLYTRKGAIEYNKWKKFEKFIDDFTIIHEREYESIVLWGEYLSYSIALGINKKCDKELYDRIEKEYSFHYEDISQMCDEQQ